ncbi:MAG: serine/threonine-protein kinase [Victivallales bacterium]
MDINPLFHSAQRLFSRIHAPPESEPSFETTLPMSDHEHEFDSPVTLPPEVLKRYLIRRPLGKGAFGIVFLAEDRKIGRLVGIKQLVKRTGRDSEIYERFMQEARIGAQLDHPNIVNVLALEEDDVSACIIMEYLGGGSLASYIKKEKKIDPNTAVRIILGVLTGLDAAHHIMVIHRDIKPQNILFGPQGEPKISDFGIALLPEIAGGIPESQDDRSRIIGTPLYMAPEQISQKPYDHRVDLYATGAVLYEMLTGKKIFNPRGDISIETMRNLVMTIEPDPIEASPSIPQALAAVTMKLLSKKPEARFGDARSTIIALERIDFSGSQRLSDSKPEVRLGSFGPLISSPAAMLEDVIRLFLVDGSISQAERRELDRRAERLGVNRLHARAIENKIRMELSYPTLEEVEDYSETVRELLLSSPGGRLGAEQRQQLDCKRQQLKISSDEAMDLEKMMAERIKYQSIVDAKKETPG